MISKDRILFEDSSCLAVQKLAGELAVGGSGRRDKLPLLDFLKKSYPGLRPVHRLDFETSGVMLFARTKAALEALMQQDEAMQKTYRALLAGNPRASHGMIRTPLPARSSAALVPAETTWRILERFPSACLVEAVIATGRHHQIRRHFASIGHPLILDDEYGHKKMNVSFQRALRMRRFFLHAEKLCFLHPVSGVLVEIHAPLPRAYESALSMLRKSVR